MRAGLDRLLVLHEVGGRALVGNDFAIGENGIAGDMVEMPMAEKHGEALCALLGERAADEARVGNRDVRVVDEGVAAIEDCVACDADRQRTVIDPILALGEDVAVDATVIERDDAFGRTQNSPVSPGATS